MQNATLERLRDEHRNLRKLLALLEQRLNSLKTDKPVDYQLLTEAMNYLVTYPDYYHHPLEDLLFARLVERAPELKTAIDALEDEHPQMAADGVTLSNLIARCATGDTRAHAELASLGQRYIDSYRAHMETEDNGIFLALEEVLTPADWVSLTTRFHWTQDPLLADEAEQRFAALRRYINPEIPCEMQADGLLARHGKQEQWRETSL